MHHLLAARDAICLEHSAVGGTPLEMLILEAGDTILGHAEDMAGATSSATLRGIGPYLYHTIEYHSLRW